MDKSYTTYPKQMLPDGRTCEVIPLTYGRARIIIGNAQCPLTTDTSY